MTAQPHTAERTPTTAEKMRRLPWSIAASTAHMIFYRLTFTSTIFVLFLNDLGLRKSQIGFLLSLFSYAGLLALLVAPRIARFGYKRSFLLSFGPRYGVTAFILLTPWILTRFGFSAAYSFIVCIVAIFAVLGALGNTAAFPWIQEYVPNAVRGKYTATTSVFGTLAGLAATAWAGTVIGRSAGVGGYMILFSIAVVFGLIALAMYFFVPGGAPIEDTGTGGGAVRNVLEAARDRNFLRFIIGVGLVQFATLPLISYVPLYLEEQVGVSTGTIALLQMGTLLGGLASSYLWGWAADRYGSKPVMSSGLAILLALPICWLFIPRISLWSVPIALSILFLQGVVDMSWAIGSGRLLYVGMVPPEKNTAYLSLYYAWIGLVGGSSQLLGGQMLERMQGLHRQIFFFSIDSYTMIFLLSFLLTVVASVLLSAVRADASVTVREFAGLFFHGNPFTAIVSLVRYHRAKDERSTVSATDRLGQTESPLTVDELLEALEDPRFGVRFEAIIAIARRRADPRLSSALGDIVQSGPPALSVIAAWALGRIGDQGASESLYAGLESDYRSIRDHAARALGSIGDAQAIPLLLERLQTEPDKGLKHAYASTLGKFKAREAAGPLLKLLHDDEDDDTQLALALALARIVGDEHHFIHLWREMRTDRGTAVSQVIASLRHNSEKAQVHNEQLWPLLDSCEEALSQGEWNRAIQLLGDIIREQPVDRFDETSLMILHGCAAELACSQTPGVAYVLLALHTMTMVWQTQT